MSSQTVMLALSCADAEDKQRRALRYLHDFGLEGNLQTVQEIPCVLFEAPEEWDDKKLDAFRVDIMRFLDTV